MFINKKIETFYDIFKILNKKVLALFVAIFIFNFNSYASTFNIYDLYLQDDNFTIINIKEDVKIKIYFLPQYRNIALTLKDKIEETHKIFQNLLGSPKDFFLTIKILDKDTFFKVTKIPSWINAIYFKKHIIIPLDNSRKNFDIELLKSLRHEYMHAFVYNLSNGGCEGWLDEGLAQWAEGNENPRLWDELEKYLYKHNALSLSNLKTSYTNLPSYLVPIAYAESLISTKYLINYYGFESIKTLFLNLKTGNSFNQSFYNAFYIKKENFDYEISNLLSSWKTLPKKQSFDSLIKYSQENNFNNIMGRFEINK